MSPIPSVDLLVYPDDCDSFGHLNQAACLRLFEHARWEAVAGGPGIDVFDRHDAWPAIRKTTIEYYASVFPGDLLRFDTVLTHLGHTSFSMHGTARRAADAAVVAEADFVFVCINREGQPTPVPDEVADFFGTRRPPGPSTVDHLNVRGISTGLDVRGVGPAVLFVHGFPLDRTMWRHVIDTLGGWRRVAPDLRGLGETAVPEGQYSMGVYAEDLLGVLDLLGIEEAVVCALSMGGYVAFELLRSHRERVRGLILLSTRADPDDDQARARRDEMIRLVREEGTGALADMLVPRLLAPSSSGAMPHVVEQLHATIRAAQPRGVIGALQAMKARDDAAPLLAGIDVPTLVVAGKEDQLIPLDYSRSLAEAIPAAHFTVVADAGHLTPLEQPVATSRVIGQFLEALS